MTNNHPNAVPEDRLSEVRALGESICSQLIEEINKLGFEDNAITRFPLFDAACYETVVDPYTGQEDITGYWHAPNGQRIGSIQFHSGGTFYAEYDVVMAHPRDPRWFVEGVTAWGKDQKIISEPKLLPALS